MTNGETKLTEVVRKYLEDNGAHCVKLSDRFTRGVPDLMVTSDRIVMVELKIDEDLGDRTVVEYGQLGMSGAQDHHVRQIYRRAHHGACCVTGKPDGTRLTLWIPVSPQSELVKNYRLGAEEWEVYNWLLGTLGVDRRPRG